jgi:hypothetical protein
MSRPRNVAELEMLLQLYYSGEPVNYTRSVTHGEAARRLVDAGVAEMNSLTGLVITDAGKFYVKHMLTIQYPVATYTFSIPQGQAA